MSRDAPSPCPALVGDPRRHPPAVPLPREERDIVWLQSSGTVVGLRPIQPEDRSALMEGFARLSEETRYQRFLAPMNRLTERQAAYLTDLDLVDHFAWAAGIRDDDGGIDGVGVARYVRDGADPMSADFAVVVADDAQSAGTGTVLVQALAVVAADHGITSLTALFLADNHRIRRILDRLDASFRPESPGVTHARVPLPAPVCFGEDAVEALLWASKVAAHPSGR